MKNHKPPKSTQKVSLSSCLIKYVPQVHFSHHRHTGETHRRLCPDKGLHFLRVRPSLTPLPLPRDTGGLALPGKGSTFSPLCSEKQLRSIAPLQGKAQKTALSSRTLRSQQDSIAICHCGMKSCCILATRTPPTGCSYSEEAPTLPPTPYPTPFRAHRCCRGLNHGQSPAARQEYGRPLHSSPPLHSSFYV